MVQEMATTLSTLLWYSCAGVMAEPSAAGSAPDVPEGTLLICFCKSSICLPSCWVIWLVFCSHFRLTPEAVIRQPEATSATTRTAAITVFQGDLPDLRGFFSRFSGGCIWGWY